MKTTRILLVVAILVAGSFVVGHWSPAQAQSVTPRTCSDLNDPSWDGVYGISSSWPTDHWSFLAGDTITLVATYVGSGPVPTGATIALWMNSGIASQTSLPGQITYTFAGDTVLPPGGSPVLNWEALDATSSLIDDTNWDVSCSSAANRGTDPALPAPGCDQSMRLTADAAVGEFVANTDVFWGPDGDATTGIILPAGKTAWVLGVDETGEFYKFIWSCTYLWAPINKMGPNFDDTWNGTPLPITIVN